MLHGDPHVGNVIVVDDNIGASKLFLEHHILRVLDLASIKILDLGTSLLWADSSQRRTREARVIFETAARLFPDFEPRKIINIDQQLDPEILLNVIDKFAEYILEISSIPRMSRDDFVILLHGLPQLLGWCPSFNYRAVGDHLKSLFHAVEAEQLIRDTRWQMEHKNTDSPEDVQQNRARKIYPSITEDVDALVKMSQTLRTPQWRFERDSEI